MKKRISQLSKLNIMLLQDGNIENNFFNFRSLIGSNQTLIKTHIDKLCNIPLFKKFTIGIPFPKELSKLKNEEIPYVQSSNFDNAIFWEANILNFFSSHINSFELMRKDFVKKFMLGKNDQALSILNEIENTFGQSIWLIENKMILLDSMEGFSELRKFVTNITKDTKINGLIRIIVEFLLIKTDKSVTYLQFEDYISDRYQELNKQDISPILFDYLTFKLNTTKNFPIQNYQNIIFIESDSSIIDRYLTFCKVSQEIVLNDMYSKNEMAKAISVMSINIEDPYFNSINYYYKGVDKLNENVFDKKVIEIIDNYSNEDYILCIDNSRNLLHESPYLIEICEIYVKSIVRSNSLYEKIDNGFLNDILMNMYNILLKNEKSNEAYHSLLKLIYVYSSHHWSKQISNFLQNEFNDDNNDMIHLDVIIAKFNSLVNTPKKYEIFLEKKQKSDYLQQLECLHSNNSTIELFKIINENSSSVIKELNDLNLSADRKKLYKAKYLKQHKEYEKALELYNEVICGYKDYLYYQAALKGKLRCLIELGRLDECITISTSAYIENNNLYKIFPIKEILDKAIDNEINDFLSLSILYDIYIRYINLNKFKFLDLQDSYEDFLYTNNIKKPRELEGILDQDNDKIIYFLRYICIPNVMDTSPEFESSSEIYKERIKVCQLLIEIDMKNHSVYSEQIKEFTSKLIIHKKMSEIEQSKIYVDIDGIKKISENKLKESYKRYMTLLSSEDSNSELNYIEIDTDDGYTVHISTNEKQIVFLKIFYEIRDMFALNSDYGLDTYLSVNIRHGTLSGMLRKPLEMEHLITLKNEKTKTYSNNEYWQDKYYIDDNDVNDILKCLNLFSKKTDDLINLLKNKWIQVSTENKLLNDGLFDFIFSPEELENLESNIHLKTTYEEFVELIFEKLWEVTDEHLEIIRNNIDEILIKKYNAIFDKFQRKIAKINTKREYQELDQSITKARTELLNSLTTVANWFKHSKTFNTQDYNIQLAIDISSSMIQNIYPNKKINISTNETDYMFLGDTLNNFVIIFYTIFDNTITHSLLTKTDMKIKTYIEDDLFNIVCTSDISPEAYSDIKVLELEEHETLLNQRKGMEKVQEEGGSGFYKIIKILNTDLHCGTKIELKFLDEKYFYLKLVIKKEGLFNENITS